VRHYEKALQISIKGSASSEEGFSSHSIPSLRQLPKRHSFIDAIAALIEAGRRGEIPADRYRFGISAHHPDTIAEIIVQEISPATGTGQYTSVEYFSKHDAAIAKRNGMWTERHAPSDTFAKLGALLAGKLDRLPPISGKA